MALDPNRWTLKTTEATCTGCHNEEHSTRFQYDAYIKTITGKGHELTN